VTREADILFLGMTRPAMFFGVPVGFFAFNIILSGGIGLVLGLALLGTPALLPIFFVFHLIGMLISKKDPHKLIVWWKFFEKSGRGRNKNYHKGSSYKG